jgi:cyclopropane-fatty-acyl-phospholipid synthase
METWIADAFLNSRFQPPGRLLQILLDLYLEAYQVYDRLTGVQSTTNPPPSEEIAEFSAELMAAHYDLPLTLFEGFLGPAMKYSMGLWETGAQTLEEAQEAMMADVVRKAGIQDGALVLDIGCGFGSLAAVILKAFPHARVCGLTLSRTQADYIRARQAAPGHPFHSDRFSLVEEDFTRVRLDRRFDRVVSLGVFEHVSNVGKALDKIRTFIRPDGVCLLHYIAYRATREGHDLPRQDAFISRYIFPGGRIWSDGEIFKHQERFRVDAHWYLNGSNYQRTIQAWLDNFHRNRAGILQGGGIDIRRLKLWEFYLRACIAVFKLGHGTCYGNGQYRLLPI